MKNAILPLLFLFLTACTPTSTDLIGNWQVTAYQTTAKLSPELLEIGRQRITTRSYEFLENDQLIFRDQETPDDIHGTWSYKPDSKLLELIYNANPYEDSIHQYELKSLSEDQMTWTSYEKIPVTEEYTLKRKK